MQPDLTTGPKQDLMNAEAASSRHLSLPPTLAKFLIVGGIAYLINQFALFLLYDSPIFWFLPAQDTEANLWLFTHPDIRLLISSVLAVEVAIIFQFNSHERWTFRDRPRKGWGLLRFLKFNLTSAGSPIIVVVTVNTLTPLFGISPYLSNTIGIAAGVGWNWTWNTLVIWPRDRRPETQVSAEMDDGRAIDDEPVAPRAVQAVRQNAIWDFALGQVRMRRALIRTLLRFALVGGSGYLVYQAILFVMYDSSLLWFLPSKDTKATIVFFTHGDVRLLITTLLAAAVVLVWVFTGHNLWTFGDRNSVRKHLWLRFGQFLATALIASAIVTVTVNVVVVQFDLYHFVALPIGIALAGIWDWIWYTQLIWRRAKAKGVQSNAEI